MQTVFNMKAAVGSGCRMQKEGNDISVCHIVKTKAKAYRHKLKSHLLVHIEVGVLKVTSMLPCKIACSDCLWLYALCGRHQALTTVSLVQKR